jgi:hypothetical protein
MSKVSGRFDRCLLVINPRGSSYKRSEKLRQSLSKSFSDDSLVVLRLTKAEFASPKHLARELEKLDESSLLAIIGGDGTVNMVISKLLLAKSKKALLATVLPLWGGNASDLAHMANGRRRSSVRQILRRGQRIAVKPMEYTLRKGHTRETGFAMCYISFGAVAFAAEVLDKSRLIRLTGKLPAVRLLAEVAVGFYGLAMARRFRASATRRHEKLYDLLLINGPRMAKLYRTPAKLSSPDFIELVVRHKYPLFVSHVSRLTRVWVRSTTVRERQLTVHEPTWMQTDGEVRQLKAETAVRIKPARQSLYLLVTK